MSAVPSHPPVHKWTWTFWLTAIAAVFLVHVALISIFGAHKMPAPPGPAKDTPSLALAAGPGADSLVLNDATLFALPGRDGFAGLMWAAVPPLNFHRLDWTEDPHWLAATNSLPVRELGTVFNRFVQTNHIAGVHLEFDLPPPPAAPIAAMEPPMARESSMQAEGGVAGRKWLNPVHLPSWPFNDVIAPSVVQVLVDGEGDVVSATLLPQDDDEETPPVRDPEADQKALEIARTMRFAPLPATGESTQAEPMANFSVGRVIFNWQAAPKTTTKGAP